MIKRIFALGFIYVCTVFGWIILAGTMMVRTDHQDEKLRIAVGQLWGTKLTQQAPLIYCTSTEAEREGKSPKTIQNLALDASNIEVDLKLDYRKKGLLWYSTYQVEFSGKYRIINSFDEPKEIFLAFTLPSKEAVYDNFKFVVAGSEIQDIELKSGRITRAFQLSPGQTENIEISYNSQGLDEWSYDHGSDVNLIRNFSLVLNTDFEDIDFPDQSISPTIKKRTNNRWELTWKYANLLTGVKIGIITPHRLNPGPWVSKVTIAAPVSLFLFFFLLFVFTTLKKIKIHPMNYFFVGAAFFSFHLLLAYLIDHISIHLAFWTCSIVSIFLVVSYMRLVVGRRFAFVEIALSQLVYLVFFSYTFFFKGYTGLAITILCICTLFVVMQFTGKVDWEQIFAQSSKTTSNKTLE